MDLEREEQDLLNDSDSDDADFVPEAPESDLSVEEDDEPKVGESKAKGKRKRASKSKGKKRRKKRGGDSEEDSEDDDDDDYVANIDMNQVAEEKPEEKSEQEKEAEKRRTDQLYDAFLSGVKALSEKKPETSTQPTTVKKVYDFAGERVEVEEKVSSTAPAKKPSSATASTTAAEPEANGKDTPVVVANGTHSKPAATSTAATTLSTPSGVPIRTRVSILSSNPAQIALAGKPGAKKGLSAILNAIQSNKKQKMGTLEKSKIDWTAFKKDSGIEEELRTHVKSKDGYVDRQEFLQRTDVRQFEIEKTLRAKQRRNNLP